MSSKLAAAVAAAVLISCAGASAASAADLYISPTGTDAGDCTSAAEPCQSFLYAETQASGTPDADTVHLAAGDYPSATTLAVPNVTWAGPQAGVPAPGRSGPQARIVTLTAEDGLTISADDIVIDGITVAGPGSNGILANNPTTVRNVRFTEVQTAITALSALTIEGSDLDTNASALTAYDDVTARDNLFRPAPGSSVVGLSAVFGALVATGNTFASGDFGILAGYGDQTTITGNRFSPNLGTGVSAGNPDTDARNNWWGCNLGPNQPGCATLGGTEAGSALTSPYLTLTGSVVPAAVATDDDAEVRATLNVNSNGDDIGPMLPGTSIAFATDGGTLAQPAAPTGADGIARDTLTAPASVGTLSPSVSLDNAIVPLSLDVVPDLSITPGEEDFGSAYVGGSTSPRPFTVTNNTSGPITIHAVGLQGLDTDNFVVFGQDCHTTLAAGASCTVSAALRPVSAGGKIAQLGVIPEGSPTAFTADLTGGGVVDDTIDINQTALTFGSVSIGGASPRQNVTVTNTGTNLLPITAITTTGDATDFVVSAGACRITLSPGQSCTFSSSLRPGASGSRAATVTIRATGHPARTVTLTGTGVDPALTITPERVDFGTVRVGTTNTRQLFT